MTGNLDADTVQKEAGEAGALAVLSKLGVDTDAGREDGRGNLSGLRLPPALGEDKNPDFSVHLRDWVCNDFGNHFQGTLYQLVQEARRCDFPAAVVWVASVCGIAPSSSGSAADSRGAALQVFKQEPWKHGRVTQTSDYRDASGALVFQVRRFEPNDPRLTGEKTFRQRRPGEGGRWINNTIGLELVPYRLPGALTAIAERSAVFVVEGERDADGLAALGLAATCNAGGAGQWRQGYAELLKEAPTVYVIPDADTAGVKHAIDVAKSFHALGVPVRILEPFGPPGSKRDVSDALADGLTLDELMPRVEASPEFDGSAPAWAHDYLSSEPKVVQETAPGDTADAEDAKKRTSSSVRLIALVEENGVELWHNQQQVPFASLRGREGRETYRIRTREFKRYLQQLFYKSEGRTASAQALEDALGALEGKAIFEGPEYPSALRVAETECSGVGELWLDLGNDAWEVARITAGGWETRSNAESPVRFERKPNQLALPAPERARPEVLRQLANFLNLDPDGADFTLVKAWLAQALRGKGPYPVLAIGGEQGSGKSTAAKRLRSLVDPNAAPLRSVPRNEQELFISATSAFMLAFDNVSGLKAWASDALCRVSTGGGLAVRELYTTDAEHVFDAQRPVILNGISDIITRQDLAERTISVSLPRIDPKRRRTEAELDAAFEQARPAIIGALLEAVADGLRRLPDVQLDSLPRLADFAVWATACERGLGIPAGGFMAAFDEGRRNLVEATVDGDPVADSVRQLIKDGETFKDTASVLLVRLASVAGYDGDKRPPKDWPSKAHVLSGELRRLAPALRDLGIEVDFTRESDKGRRRLITLRQENGRQQASEASKASKPAKTGQNG